LSARTARRYTAAAEYVAGKMDTVSNFGNLAPTVLYGLAAGHYGEQEEAAILVATNKGRVDQELAWAIREKFAPADDNDAAEDGDDSDDQEGGGGEEDAESEKILDGPPPDVPPPAPIPPPPDFALRDFDEAIGALKRLMTKPSVQFTCTIHSADELESVGDFIRAVANKCERTSTGDDDEVKVGLSSR
jgi:hypothetical protein